MGNNGVRDVTKRQKYASWHEKSSKDCISAAQLVGGGGAKSPTPREKTNTIISR